MTATLPSSRKRSRTDMPGGYVVAPGTSVGRDDDRRRVGVLVLDQRVQARAIATHVSAGTSLIVVRCATRAAGLSSTPTMREALRAGGRARRARTRR